MLVQDVDVQSGIFAPLQKRLGIIAFGQPGKRSFVGKRKRIDQCGSGRQVSSYFSRGKPVFAVRFHTIHRRNLGQAAQHLQRLNGIGQLSGNSDRRRHKIHGSKFLFAVVTYGQTVGFGQGAQRRVCGAAVDEERYGVAVHIFRLEYGAVDLNVDWGHR